MIAALRSAETKKRAQEIKNETQIRWLLYAFANKELIPQGWHTKNLAQATINLMLSMGWCMDLVYMATVIFLANLRLSDDYTWVLYWYAALYKAAVHMGHCDFPSPVEYASLCKESLISLLRAI